MAAIDRQHYALQTIFSFFLGLMVLAFIGVGVNTFYESPATRVKPQIDDLERQMDSIKVQTDGRTPSPIQQAELDKLSARQNQLQRSIEGEMKTWARNTSIVLVVFATLVLVVSLIRSEQLRVLSNGLLLGGLFAMLYGTGWAISSQSSTARFAVITFGLLVAIGLGYLKFVHERSSKADTHAAVQDEQAAEQPVVLREIEERVRALEEHTSAAAAALSGEKLDVED